MVGFLELKKYTLICDDLQKRKDLKSKKNSEVINPSIPLKIERMNEHLIYQNHRKLIKGIVVMHWIGAKDDIVKDIIKKMGLPDERGEKRFEKSVFLKMVKYFSEIPLPKMDEITVELFRKMVPFVNQHLQKDLKLVYYFQYVSKEVNKDNFRWQFINKIAASYVIQLKIKLERIALKISDVTIIQKVLNEIYF